MVYGQCESAIISVEDTVCFDERIFLAPQVIFILINQSCLPELHFL